MRCPVCHKPLKSAASIARGIGPLCAQKAQRGGNGLGNVAQRATQRDTLLEELALALAREQELLKAAERAAQSTAVAERHYRLALESLSDTSVKATDGARHTCWAHQRALAVVLDETREQIKALKRMQRKSVA